MSRISHRFRGPSIETLLYRHNILQYYKFRPLINLTSDVPRNIVRILCSTPPIFDQVDFAFDVAWLISDMRRIRALLSHMIQISSITVHFHPSRLTSLVQSLEMGIALKEFFLLASNLGCRFILIKNDSDAMTSEIVDQKWFSLAYRAAIADWQSPTTIMATSDVNGLNIPSSLFTCPFFLRWSSSFSGSTSLRSLVLLQCATTRPHYDKFLRNLTLPNLRAFVVRGVIAMNHLAPFLLRHPYLELLELTSMNEVVSSPLAVRGRISLDILTSLVITFDYVECFIAIIDTPRLISLNLHVRESPEQHPYRAVELLSAHPRLHAITLRLTFDGELFFCFPTPLPAHHPVLRNLTVLYVQFAEEVFFEEDFVSETSPILL
jgi:hypothetical protein